MSITLDWTVPAQGKPGTSVVLHGAGLSTVTSVRWGGISVAFTYDSTALTIACTVPDPAGANINTITVADGSGNSATINFAVWYPGAWIQPPASYWGVARAPLGAFITSTRDWGDVPVVDYYALPDSSVQRIVGSAEAIWSNGEADASFMLTTTGASFSQGTIVVDTQAIWDNPVGTYDLHYCMDPQPPAAIPTHFPTGVVLFSGTPQHEWQGSDDVTSYGTFAGKYRFTVTATGDSAMPSQLALMDIQLRRMLPTTYVVGSEDVTGGSSTPLVDHWIYPADLGSRPILFAFAADSYKPTFGHTTQTMGTYELFETDLDGRKHGIVVTNEKYAVGDTLQGYDNEDIKIYGIVIEFFYYPQQYRWFFTAPQIPEGLTGAIAGTEVTFDP